MVAAYPILSLVKAKRLSHLVDSPFGINVSVLTLLLTSIFSSSFDVPQPFVADKIVRYTSILIGRQTKSWDVFFIIFNKRA